MKNKTVKRVKKEVWPTDFHKPMIWRVYMSPWNEPSSIEMSFASMATKQIIQALTEGRVAFAILPIKAPRGKRTK